MSAGPRGRLEAFVRDAWFALEPSLPARVFSQLMRPLSLLAAGIASRRRARIHEARGRRRANDVPVRPAVIVIGNLVVGGAGKTPIVLALAEALAGRGLRVGLVCRGHGGSASGAAIVPPTGDAAHQGDEAVLLARVSRLPVAAARARRDALDLLVSTHPGLDVVLSDDGLQHEALPRDLEIAVFDARGAGNGRVLPAGPLREPIAGAHLLDALLLNQGWQATPIAPPIAHARVFASRLRVRDLVPIKRWLALDGESTEARSATAAPDAVAGPGPAPVGPGAAPAIPPELLGRRVLALAAIGNPAGFFGLVRTLGIDATAIALPDHAGIDSAFIASRPEPAILLTEKDAVKCVHDPDPRIWVLRVRAEPDPGFVDWIHGELHGPTTA